MICCKAIAAFVIHSVYGVLPGLSAGAAGRNFGVLHCGPVHSGVHAHSNTSEPGSGC